ncbi:MAG: GTPase Era [Holophagaceae bacterium]|nr:GTPase Era [Holophagaceae bacterium]
MSRKYATVAIVGLPNVGKSTFLNVMVGEKIAAVSQTPQTTRTKILGVVNQGEAQLAFLDTPGIHRGKYTLDKRMMAHVDIAIAEADIILWMVDSDGFFGPKERELAKRLKSVKQPVYLLINKIDLVATSSLLEKVVAYKDLASFKEIVPIGAKHKQNIEPLWELLQRDAPEREWQYSESEFTDQTERTLATEFIREKVLRKTREEVPHGVAVIITEWAEEGVDYPEDMKPGGVFIRATVLCDREGHRKILLGKGGEMIKDIRQSAQRELKKMLQRPTRLELYIKVDVGWRDKQSKLDWMKI